MMYFSGMNFARLLFNPQKRRPCVYLLILFLPGLFGALCFPINPLLSLAVFILLTAGACSARQSKAFGYIGVCALMSFSLFWCSSYFHYREKSHIDSQELENGALYIIRGKVASDAYGQTLPLKKFKGVSSTESEAFLIECEALVQRPNFSKPGVEEKISPLGGRILARVNHFPKARYGDNVEMLGYLREFRGQRNPGGYDNKKQMYLRRISCTLNVEDPNHIRILEKGSGWNPMNLMYREKEDFSEFLLSHFDERTAAIYGTILLGNRSTLEEDERDAFVTSGTVHLLSISGLHLVLTLGLFMSLFKSFGFGYRKRALLLMIVAVGYTLYTGSAPPTVRAMIMSLTLLGGQFLFRRVDFPNSLSLAALVILLLRPYEIAAPGFYLTFSAVLGIKYITPFFKRIFLTEENPDQALWNSGRNLVFHQIKSTLLNSACVSAGASLGVLPFSLYFFNVLSFAVIIANILAVFIFFIMLVLGLSMLFLFHLAPPLASFPIPLAAMFANLLSQQAQTFSQIQWGHLYLPDYHWLGYLLYAGFMATLAFPIQLFWRCFALRLLLALLLTAFTWFHYAKENKGPLRLEYLDVGNGCATVIHLPDGGVYIWDCGTRGTTPVGKTVLAPYLWETGVFRIDGIVISHADFDHYGGLRHVLDRFQVKTLYINPQLWEVETTRELLNEVKNRNVEIKEVLRGDRIFDRGGCSMEILHPKLEHMKGEKQLSRNDASLAGHLQYQNQSILFLSDIETDGLQLFLPELNIKPVLMNVPHHGSAMDRHKEMLEHLKPKHAILSSTYKFPSPKTLGDYEELGCLLWKTSELGGIEARFEDQGRLTLSGFLESR